MVNTKHFSYQCKLQIFWYNQKAAEDQHTIITLSNPSSDARLSCVLISDRHLVPDNIMFQTTFHIFIYQFTNMYDEETFHFFHSSKTWIFGFALPSNSSHIKINYIRATLNWIDVFVVLGGAVCGNAGEEYTIKCVTSNREFYHRFKSNSNSMWNETPTYWRALFSQHLYVRILRELEIKDFLRVFCSVRLPPLQHLVGEYCSKILWWMIFGSVLQCCCARL